MLLNVNDDADYEPQWEEDDPQTQGNQEKPCLPVSLEMKPDDEPPEEPINPDPLPLPQIN